MRDDAFIALPLSLPAIKSHTQIATHYLYLKPHDPNPPTEDSSRSLFLVNIPVTSTPRSLKTLLSQKLQGGLIENIYFSLGSENGSAQQPTGNGKRQRSRKRKRMTADEITSSLDTQSNLPRVWESEIHASGSTAVVVFVDKASLEMTLKAARRAARHGLSIPWQSEDDQDQEVESKSTAVFGLPRYTSHKTLQYPPRATLLKAVNAYMTTYATLESTRQSTSRAQRLEPDAEGFVTVTRGSKGAASPSELKALAEKQAATQKQKASEMETNGFYRFQNRERRKGAEEGVRRRFEEDVAKVEEMRKRRRRGEQGG